MKILYLQSAQRDLQRLHSFLNSAGVSQHKSDSIIRELVERLRILTNHPHIGFNIGGKYGFTTPYRAFLAGSYIAIYEVVGKQVEIRRIYHQKEDYLSTLLSP